MTSVINNTINDTINDAIENYYKLKHTYEERINKQKQKILRDPSLSIKEKRQKWLGVKKMCCL